MASSLSFSLERYSWDSLDFLDRFSAVSRFEVTGRLFTLFGIVLDVSPLGSRLFPVKFGEISACRGVGRMEEGCVSGAFYNSRGEVSQDCWATDLPWILLTYLSLLVKRQATRSLSHPEPGSTSE